MGNLKRSIAKQIFLSLGLFFSFSQLSAMCPQTVGTVTPGEGIWQLMSRIGEASNVIQSQICALNLIATATSNISCTFIFGQSDIQSGGVYIISAPGTYCMRETVNFSTSFAITVSSNDVTVDLEGHTIKGTGTATTGIILNNGFQNIIIQNGTIENLAGGCPDGIAIRDVLGSVTPLKNITIQDINFNNNNAAIQLTLATAPTLDVDGLLIRNCNAYNSGGIFATAANGIIQGCVVDEHRGNAFLGGIVLQGNVASIAQDFLVQDCIVTSSVGNTFGYIALAFVDNGVIKNCISLAVALDAFDASFFNKMVIADCVAQANGIGDGFSVYNPLPGGALLIERCVASSCGDSGFVITNTSTSLGVNTFSAVKVLDCVAENNVANGFVFLNFLSMGNSLVARCCALENGSNGFLVGNSYINPGPFFNMSQFIFEDCVSQGNIGDGFSLLSAQANGTITNVIFRNCIAQGNVGGFDGFSIFQGDGFGIGTAAGGVAPNLGGIGGVICDHCIAQDNVNGFNFGSTATLSKIIDCCAMNNTSTGISNQAGITNAIVGNAAFDNGFVDITGLPDPSLLVSRSLVGGLAGATRWVNAIS
jgi:hypothetical protein